MTPDTLTIDPLLMNLVHRFGPDSEIRGNLQLSGGVLVQGTLCGEVVIDGPLLIWSGATVCGTFHVSGDVYVFGEAGRSDEAVDATHIRCDGTACVASSAVLAGTLSARHFNIYQGADLRGSIRSLADSTLQVDTPGSEGIDDTDMDTSKLIAAKGSQVRHEIEDAFGSPAPQIPSFSR
ncbi:MAG: polymer-forming cytoskeletal protein [Hydrogenophaga sp.]|nr:polymer-forming cytoskeletal protein [Hydrogenophaga sp.]